MTHDDVMAVFKSMPDTRFKMFGFRNNSINVYDDVIYTWADGDVKSFKGNTQPSILRENMACLVTNKVFYYKIGIHGLSKPPSRRYRAFVQDSDVIVNRYNTGIDQGRFGINIHRGGVNGTSSLGCQTIIPSLWPTFFEYVSNMLFKFQQQNFPYMVVTGATYGNIINTKPISKQPLKYYTSKKGSLTQLTNVHLTGDTGYTPVRPFVSQITGIKEDEIPFVWKNLEDNDDENDVLLLNNKVIRYMDVIDNVTYGSIGDLALACGKSVEIKTDSKIGKMVIINGDYSTDG